MKPLFGVFRLELLNVLSLTQRDPPEEVAVPLPPKVRPVRLGGARSARRPGGPDEGQAEVYRRPDRGDSAGAPGQGHGQVGYSAAWGLPGHVLPLESALQQPGQGEAAALGGLEEENRRLKRMVDDQALNIQVLKDAMRKEW